MNLRTNMLAAALTTTAFLAPVSALAQSPAVQVLSRSGVISSPGHYLVDNEFRMNGSRPAAIMIESDGVTLDLGGHGIWGMGGKQGVGVMIRNSSGVKVFNGAMNKLAFGVVVENSRNVVIRDLRISGEGLPIVELPPETGIMIIQSRNVVVEDNAIYNTGLGIFVRGGQSWGNRVAHNTITAGTNGALGICYNPGPSDPMAPRGDLIDNNVVTGFGLGIQMKETAFYNVIRNNVVAFVDMGLDLQNESHIAVDNQLVQLQ